MRNEYTIEEKIVHLNGQVECLTNIGRDLVEQLGNHIKLIQ